MDYKEKYEKALGKAKEFYANRTSTDNGIIFQHFLEDLFPELRESEDERIRKNLIELLLDTPAQDIISHNLELSKVLAYLEKQKENPKSADSIPPDCASDAKCENSWHKVADSLSDREVLKRIEEVVQYLKEHNYTVAVEDSHPKYYEIKIHRHDDDFWLSEEYKYCRHIIGEYYYEGNFGGDIFTIYVLRSKEKQKEQKGSLRVIKDASEWEKIKEQKPVKLDDDTEVGLDRALQIVKDAKGNLCGYQSDDGIYECDHAIQTLERILKNGIEQKAAEWSEKDEAMRDNILRVLSCFVGTAECESNPSLSTSYPLYRREIDWLKSLRLDLKKKNEDVAKLCSNEWSEEDENKLNHILEIVHIASGTEASVNEKEELESFLKSLRPQPKQEWNEEDEENFKWFDKFFRAESIVLGGRDIPQDKYLWFKSLRSRPKSSDTWKPSVEQMEALQYSIGNGGKYNKDALESLYNDLKKLM